MWPSRLFWKIFLVSACLIIALAGGLLVFMVRWHREQVTTQVWQSLHNAVILLHSKVAEPLLKNQDEPLQPLIANLGKETGIRMTLVAADGTVIADSQENPQAMENHSSRPELRQAAAEGQGNSTRLSPTLGIRMFYFAKAVQKNDDLVAFVRVATGVQSAERQVAEVQGALWTFAITVGIVALAITYTVVGRIMQPIGRLTESARSIAAGSYEQHVPVEGNDELGQLAMAFNRMCAELTGQVHQLRENGQRLATVLGSMVEGVIAVDASQRVLLANEASRKLLELPELQVEGRPLEEVTRLPAIQSAVHTTLGGRSTTEAEFQVDGAIRRSVSLRATRLPGTPCPGVVLVLHDVTELRQLENLRREFVANVSHELKTPLASIKAYAETLRMGAMNDPEHNVEFLDRIEEQSDRLLQLILDMLQLARVESGQEVFDITDVPVAEVVDRCLANYTNAAETKQIALEVFPPQRPTIVRADQDSLFTILDNLVSNAIKYTQEAGAIQIRWQRHENEVEIVVADNGLGIPAEAQSRIFERFYRVDEARSRDLGGTGLGLSIVKHLTQSLDGSISLDSQPGQGSRFTVRLPSS